VCATESVFFHVTVVPTVTFRASGAKAWFASVEAPIGMVTADAEPSLAAGDDDEADGDEEGDAAGDGVEE
jgi:hypothetical protein